MHYEIERKFLVEGDYKSVSISHSHIEQGYFITAPGRTVRIRIRDDRAYLTIKGPAGNDGLKRYEFETEVSIEDGRQLMALCGPGRIDKTRWLVPAGNHTFEVDEFHGDNEGLVVAEVELASMDESFERPSFLGKEVTGDRRYYNSHLMRFPFKDWK